MGLLRLNLRLWKISKYCCIILVLFGTGSCDKKDYTPPPAIVDFQWTRLNTFGTLTISFHNQSVSVPAFKWDFGDGSPTSNIVNPTHTYNAAGTYTITLTGYDKDGKEITTVQKEARVSFDPVAVRLNQLNMSQFPTTNGSGQPWDGTDGPDMYFIVQSSGGVTIYNGQSDVHNNVTSGQWQQWFLNPQILITDVTSYFTIRFMDRDAPGTDQEMGSIMIRPSDYFNGSNPYTSFSLNSNGFSGAVSVSWQF